MKKRYKFFIKSYDAEKGKVFSVGNGYMTKSGAEKSFDNLVEKFGRMSGEFPQYWLEDAEGNRLKSSTNGMPTDDLLGDAMTRASLIGEINILILIGTRMEGVKRSFGGSTLINGKNALLMPLGELKAFYKGLGDLKKMPSVVSKGLK